MSRETETLFNTIFNNLSQEDQNTYFLLKKAFAQPTCKNRRSKSTDTFFEIINSLKIFIVRGQSSDAYRAFVCGICFFHDVIAINTRYLRTLISKCKSSINGLFQSMNYGTLPFASDYQTQLIKFFPFIKENYGELRQWTFRKKVDDQNITVNKIIQEQIQKYAQVNQSFAQTIISKTQRTIHLNEDYITPPPDPVPTFNGSNILGTPIIHSNSTLSTSVSNQPQNQLNPNDSILPITDDDDLLSNFGLNSESTHNSEFDFLDM